MSLLESWAIERDSRVVESKNSPGVFPSSASLVEPGTNSGGPPPKTKYLLPTDSE